MKCALGTYTNKTGQDVCQPCDPGYACAEGSSSPRPSANKCPKGYYCPDGNVQTACPAGMSLSCNAYIITDFINTS